MNNLTRPQKLFISILAIVACFFMGFSAVAGYYFLTRSTVPAAPLPPNTTEPPTPGPAPTPIVLDFDGQGDKVLFFDTPASGAALFGFGHRGERNFIVNLLKSDGTFVELLVNDIGTYDGEKTLQLDQGSYMLEITADGPWIAVILPPQ